ncbi:MAG: hypothetical protein MHMPM18_000160 [Marteilia pararefringens]
MFDRRSTPLIYAIVAIYATNGLYIISPIVVFITKKSKLTQEFESEEIFLCSVCCLQLILALTMGTLIWSKDSMKIGLIIVLASIGVTFLFVAALWNIFYLMIQNHYFDKQTPQSGHNKIVCVDGDSTCETIATSHSIMIRNVIFLLLALSSELILLIILSFKQYYSGSHAHKTYEI